MTVRLFFILFLTQFVVPQVTFAQDSALPDASSTEATPVRDPRATAVADATLKALAPQSVLADIAMQGTVTRTAGSDTQSGTFTFEASGDAKTRVVLSLDGGQQQEVRSGVQERR